MRKFLLSKAVGHFPFAKSIVTCMFLLGSMMSVLAQSGPVFTQHPDITVSCEDAIPSLDECEATSPNCDGPVTITSFESESGSIEHNCSLSPSKLGNSIGWAFWLSLENMPVERWKFDGPAYFQQYEDGTAHLYGTIVNYLNASYKFEVSMWFSSKRSWSEWSALGRGYRNESGLAGSNYIDWDYYELLGEFSTFTGIDALEGNYLNIGHYPTSLYYGFQSGVGANNKNANSGFGGAFCYTGMILGEHCGAGVGHLSVDTDCDNGNDGCASTSFTKICKAVDTCGNVAFHTQTVNVVDNTAPVVNEYESIISVPCGDHYQNFISATDNCSDVVITYTDQLINPGCGGQILRTYKIADACGNFVNATQTINLEGDASPEFIVFPIDTYISCSQTDELNNAILQWTGPCNNIEINHTDVIVPGDCPGEYTLIRTYELTDDCGNSTTRVWTVQVQDNIAPVLAGVPGNLELNCGDEIPEADVTVTDNCDLSVVNVTLVATTEFTACGYNFIRTWTAVDGCGNVAEAVQTISLTDQQPPQFTFVPANINLACSDNTSIDDLEIATATDDCLGVIVLFEDTPLAGNCGDGFVRTFTATDACGNTVTAEQTISFTDDVDPEFSFVPSAITVNCGDEISIPDAIATDNCSSVVVTYQDDFSASCGGGFTRVFSATDGCGNVASASVTVSVIDNVAPQIIAAPIDVTVDCNSIPAVEDNQIEYTDDCGAVTIQFNENIVETPGTCAGSYAIVREWVLTDDCGNSTVATWIITVQDNIAPVFQGVPADLELNCGDAIPEANVIAIDNCDPNVNVTLVATTEFNDCGYNFIRTWTAIDVCGNVAEAVQIISLTDLEPPVFTFVPENVNLACTSGSSIDDLEIAEASDDCLGVVVLFEDTPIGGNCGDGILRTFTATDACGNTVVATQTITFTDEIDPEFSFVPSDITINCGDAFELPDAIAIDNCSSVVVTFEDISSASCGGGFTRTYTATDGCGNVTTASVDVTIIDTVAPQIIAAPDDVTVDCNSIPAVEDNQIQYIDDCGAVSIQFDETIVETPGTCAGSYAIVREWILTDDCGNSSMATWTITVQDNIAPVLQGVPTDMELNCGDAIPEANVIAIDNCDPNVNVTLVATTEFNTCGYNFIRTWTAVDACGNVAEAVQVISLTDLQPPVFTFIPDAVNLACSEGNSLDDLEIAEASDDCLGVVVLFEDMPLGGDCGDGILRTFTATDACGNSVTATQFITFSDNIPPVFTFVPEDVISECGAEIVIDDAIATDNCSSVVVTFEDEQGEGCSYVRTYTATDGCGNISQVSVSVLIQDNTPPVISGIPNSNELGCGDVDLEIEVVVTDNCTLSTDIIVTEESTTEAIPCGFIVTKTWTATDECGNTTQSTYTATLLDNEQPEFTYVPSDISVDCGEEYTLEDPIAVDDCSNLSIVTEIQPLTNCAGSYIRIFTATDACGNVATAQQTITVSDNEFPVFINLPENVTVGCGEIPTMDSADITYSDNCGVPSMNVQEDIELGDCAGNYVITRLIEIQDVCGNRTYHTWVITVEDNTAPIFNTASQNLILDCGSVVPPLEVLATDNCDGEITYSNTEETIQLDCGYQLLRTRTATDACGNTAVFTQTVTVEDFAPPVFSFLPASVTIDCSDALPELIMPTAEDECSGFTNVTVEESSIQGDCPGSFTLFRLFRATDNCDNEAMHLQTITIADMTGPSFINFEPEITVDCTESNTPFVIVIDNCNTASLVFTDEVFGSPCNGGIVRTYVATDVCGNETVMQQMITLIDEEAPEFISFPADLEVSCDAVPLASSASIEYQDNCSNVQVLYSESIVESNCPSNYTLQRVWTLVDNCFNTSTRTWTIEVSDTEAPTIVGAPADVFIDCSASIPPAEVFAVDNCSDVVPVTLFAITVPDGCNEIFIRRWYAEDACGNLSQAIQNVIITDLFAPELSSYPEDIELTCGATLPEVPLITAIDNCADNLEVDFVESTGGGTPNCQTITRTWCAADCIGNEVCHTQTISFTTAGGMVLNNLNAWSINTETAKIEVTSAENERWTLNVYDLNGKLVNPLFAGEMAKGETRTFTFNPVKYSDTIYIVHFTNGKDSFTKKLFFSE